MNLNVRYHRIIFRSSLLLAILSTQAGWTQSPIPALSAVPTDSIALTAGPSTSDPATPANDAKTGEVDGSASERTGGRRIHVVVVAVPKFSIAAYNSDVIRDSFRERCNAIKTYFESRLGSANVKVDQYCTAESTTREALRHLFSVDIPHFSANTVTLLFIMSHGESVEFQNGFLSNDVELITSDTRITDDDEDADSTRRFTSILVGSELLNWLQTAPRGSTILTFLDFCHSGAAASLAVSQAQELGQHFGLRSLVVGSSLPGDGTYKALFTQALLDLWDTSSGCMNLDTMPTAVLAKMKLGAPLTGTEGLPVVLVPYRGPLCLGNFGGDHNLLFLYGGHDAERAPYTYQVSMADGDHKTIISSILATTFLPIPLDKGRYSISITREATTIGSWDIDFSSGPTEIIWLDTAAKPRDLGQFSEQVAETANRAGVEKSEVAKIQARTAAIYRLVGSTTDATRIEQKMISAGTPLSIFVAEDSAALAANPTTKALLTSVSMNDSDHSIQIAEGLKLLGDIKSAAKLLQLAAKQETHPDIKADVATQAYLAYIASGDVNSAVAVKQQFGLVGQPLNPSGTKLPVDALQSLRTAGIAASFGAHTF